MKKLLSILAVILAIVGCTLQNKIEGIINLFDEYEFQLPHASAVIAIFAASAGIAWAFFNFMGWKSRGFRAEEAKSTFDTIVSNLSSTDNTTRLSAAILLRRFFTNKSKHFARLRMESINVISAMLKVIPTGVFQKTLADGLSYATDLSGVDLQKTNLQDVYLGKKTGETVLIDKTDLFLSDLSYALIEGVEGKAIFYRSILFCAQIKNCNFSNANFRESDLTGATFINVYLDDADFSNAVNIPMEIQEGLVDGKYNGSEPVTAERHTLNKTIFFSMPSVMSKSEELFTKDFKRFLEEQGYDVIYYIRDDYPCFGQLNRVREKILSSEGMVAFGFKQINIQQATYRPKTDDEEIWNDKWISTPWSEIEVGMGLMKGMPIMLVKDPSIENGIFDEKLSECFIAKVSTTDDSRKFFQNKEIAKWLSKVGK